MALQTEFESQGNWLFQRRSYLPLALLSLVAIAVAGYQSPFQTEIAAQVWEWACVLVSFLGLGVRCAAVGVAPKGTSGRTTQQQSAASLNTTGVYSIVRHPLYVGNYVMGLGVTLVLFVWWLPVVYSLIFWLYYERIMFAEERFLERTFGRAFLDWADATPAFIPRFENWRPAALPFSTRNVLRREYTGVLFIVALHSGVNIAKHAKLGEPLAGEGVWAAFLVAGACVYAALRTAKKKTSWLNVAGR